MVKFHESRGEVSPRQRDCQRNVHDVVVVGGFCTNSHRAEDGAALHGIGGRVFDARRNRFDNELGRWNCGTGETWKDKFLFRFVLNKVVSDEIVVVSKALHGTRNDEILRILSSSGPGHRSVCFEDVGSD